MRHVICSTVLFFALSCASASSFAATIPIFGTGLNSSGQFLSMGAVDPHYTLTLNYLGNGSNAFVPDGASPSQAMAEGVPQGWPLIPDTWATDNLAQWIAPQADVVGIPGTGFDTFYTYQTTFDLTGFSLASVQLSGHWTADNFLTQVALNGVPIFTSAGCGSSSFAFQNLTPFSISSGFQAGVNTLSFNVTNSTCSNSAPLTNPTGLLVDISGTGDAVVTAVPEAATMLPVTLGLALAGFLYRRRRHNSEPCA